MFWIVICTLCGLLIICECIQNCVDSKYKWQDTCCCDTCPYRDECLEVCGDE